MEKLMSRVMNKEDEKLWKYCYKKLDEIDAHIRILQQQRQRKDKIMYLLFFIILVIIVL